MQQNIVVVILASIIGLFLSSYWMFHEIQFVSIMSEFDQNISWLFQVPLMIFIAILILVSFILFIRTIGDFNFSKLKAEIPWKKLLGIIIVYNFIIIVLILIGDYLKIEKSFIAQLLVVILLVTIYIYASVKYKINPLFFLVSLCAVSTAFLYMIFEVIL